MELRLDFSIDLIMIEFGVKGMMGEIVMNGNQI